MPTISHVAGSGTRWIVCALSGDVPTDTLPSPPATRPFRLLIKDIHLIFGVCRNIGRHRAECLAWIDEAVPKVGYAPTVWERVECAFTWGGKSFKENVARAGDLLEKPSRHTDVETVHGAGDRAG